VVQRAIVDSVYARVLPTVGRPVRVVFLDGRVAGTVVSVDGDGRGLLVVTDDGEAIRFTLQRTTGRFQAGDQTGPRLYFAGDRTEYEPT
jgi:hypothetical protein